ncbi:MAG TPA: FkbM family methyltransferase [Candidatus Baltobacteraceae bacterium]
MKNDQVLARRRAINEERGDAFLTDLTAQNELLFVWDGSTIVDRLGDRPIEYFYPSTIGQSLFYHGGFEVGEIAFVRRAIEQIEAPTILDVGSNIGLHAVSWCAASPSATCYAFEPVAANRDVLARNAHNARVDARIVVEPAAVGAQTGTATFYECTDAAYSTLDPQAAMPIVATYDVPVTSIDDFVATNNVARVDVIKIDSEGWEDAVLQGAAATIERDAPFLVVELSKTNAKAAAPEEIVNRLQQRGYRAFIINDGIVTEYDGYDEYAYNYFFAHASRPLEIPKTDPIIARTESTYHSVLVRSMRRSLVNFRAELKAKDDEIHRLKDAADERLAVIQRVSSQAAAAAQAPEKSDNEAKLTQRVLELEKQVGQRDARLSALEGQIDASSSGDPSIITASVRVLGEMRLEIERRDATIAALRVGLEKQREEVDRQHTAAVERLRLLEKANERHQQTHEQLEAVRREHEVQRKAAEERHAVIERLQGGLGARDGQVASKGAELERLKVEVRAKDAVIDKLDELVRSGRGESAQLREMMAHQEQAIAELQALSAERLEVIRALHEQRA